MPHRLYIGTAGWSMPAAPSVAVAAEGSQLARYATVLDAVEINTSFHRPHRPGTYERWAASTPAHFRFAVKCPKQITHEARLVGIDDALARFAGDAGALGRKWAVLLVQLPPSLRFDAAVAGRFFERLRKAFGGACVCEPRHPSWFTPEAERLMRESGVARAAVDPAHLHKWPGADQPAGHAGVAYFRWHGSPRVYWSDYDEAWLWAQAERLALLPEGVDRWCIFDNTASGAAWGNALALRALA